MKINAGLHVNAALRRKKVFSEGCFEASGKALLSMPEAARAAQALARETGAPCSGSELYLMSQLEAVKRFLARRYFKGFAPGLLEGWSRSARFSERALREYVGEYPPEEVYRGTVPPAGWLSYTGAREESVIDLLQLLYAAENPAYRAGASLFDLTRIKAALQESPEGLKGRASSPRALIGGAEYTLADIFEAGTRRSPDSLYGQLQYYIDTFPEDLEEILPSLLQGLDFYTEETRPRGGGPGEAKLPDYSEDVFLTGEERYSPDSGWMPNTVMMAKNVRVWLWQLSRKYGRDISSLDRIPDEELDALQQAGFTALWLIGLWERGEASRTIKRWNGNPQAESSAYSVKEYTISHTLGGGAALEDLKRRALARGIRLASDMVPNHTSLDSPLLMEHPEYYISRRDCPYPSYRFSGENLSGRENPRVYLEDHYFDRTDAAVVFKYSRDGDGDRYIYHGNDGTNMPWNDTAQLDFLQSRVREYVKDTIIRVAKQFPIIRFDAAMTLTKKHFQRLWYPQPGSGGDIPTRAAEGLSREEFDRLFPAEFWREVVDAAAAEAPDTLLLAEAFWLLEGYFVRTLGMHRVYNSAFMNMLRDEENGKYHDSIRMTLEFDPDILQRYVNFMSNPDEKTAKEQFGSDDKYFGVCTLMCTLPGLPMFAHGQLEGFAEKYGMEYARAYYDEEPDRGFEERHRREIFPLLRQRSLFAGAENFAMFEFLEGGGVNKNVFAYANRQGQRAALVFFNNRYAQAEGAIRASVPFRNKKTGETRSLSLAEYMGWTGEEGCYVIYRDLTDGLEYIRNAAQICREGFGMSLGAYKYAVLTDFRSVRDNEFSHYGMVWDALKGAGCPSVEARIAGIKYGPLHGKLSDLLENISGPGRLPDRALLLQALEAAGEYSGAELPAEAAADKLLRSLEYAFGGEAPSPCAARALFVWAFLRAAAFARFGTEDPVKGAALAEEWQLDSVLVGYLQDGDCPLPPGDVLRIIKAATANEQWADGILFGDEKPAEALMRLIGRDATGAALKVNRFEGTLWFNREAFELWTELTVRILRAVAREAFPGDTSYDIFTELLGKRLRECGSRSGWRLDSFISNTEREFTI